MNKLSLKGAKLFETILVGSARNVQSNSKPSEDKIKDFKEYLSSKDIKNMNGWAAYKLNTCLESKDNKSFFLDKTNGDFHCLKCNLSGDWQTFKNTIDLIKDKASCSNQRNTYNDVNKISSRNDKLAKLWISGIPLSKLAINDYDMLIAQSEFKFELKTLENYNTRAANELLLLPLLNKNKEIIKIFSLNSDDLYNNHTLNGHVYGLHLIDPNKQFQIYITDSILNALAIHQVTHQPVIALNSIEALDIKVLSVLEGCTKVTLWFKDVKLALKIASRLNSKRCHLINNLKTPYECLRSSSNIYKILKEESFPLLNDNIDRFDKLKDRVYEEVINFKKYAGTKWIRFPGLNRILKGHRLGELTVFSGATGSGKTTFLSEYSIDLCIQGIETLWGSFEIQNHRLAKIMMTQYSSINLAKNVDLFPEIANQFNRLPLHFMSFYGQESVENVIKTMSNAVILHDIKHVIIDNLQFMLGTTRNFGGDRFQFQDFVIGSFRAFATNFNCHVTLVIHPRKEDSDELLKISSIFGTAKACQEADNILILQEKASPDESKAGKIKFIQICKNRYDGELGNMVIHFNKDTLSFTERDNKKRYNEENRFNDASNELDDQFESPVIEDKLVNS